MERNAALRSLLMATLAGLAFVVSANAATVTVNSTADAIHSPGCATTGTGTCSLRDAIIFANANAGADTITLPAGTYTLSLTNAGNVNEDAAATGDLDITDSVTINGGGAGSTFIQAGTTTLNGIDKVIAVNPTCDHAVNVTIDGVTIRFGRNTQPDGAADFSFTGGGLDFCGFGFSTFTLSNSAVTLNTATDGYGGGINIDEVEPGASVVSIINTSITSNTANQMGGGINVFGDNTTVAITGSTISNNTALGVVRSGAGGANIRLYAFADGDGAPVPSVSITSTPVTNNVGAGFGGGISVAFAGAQDVTVSGSAVTGNTLNVGSLDTSTAGGGIYQEGNLARTTRLTDVLVANNQSNGGASGAASKGGGIFAQDGVLVLRNSTVSGNSAKSDGGGLSAASGPSISLTNSTIANNRADSDNTGGGTGGSIRNLGAAAAVVLQNTISDGNLGTSAAVSEISGAVTANFSLIANTTGATVTGASNQLNVSARLGALANNGGSSQTHALLAGSPALDTGSNALATGAGLTTDQRGTGFVRTADAADADTTDTVDMGAFEAHPVVEDLLDTAINEDGFLSTSFNLGDSNLTGGLDTITVTSSNTTLVPNSNINLGGSGLNTLSNSASNNPTLVIAPLPNLFGTTTITVTTTDVQNSTTQTMTDTFVLTVNPVADPPAGTNATTNEDTQTTSGLVLSRNPADGAEVTHFKILSITNGALFQSNGTTAINVNDVITFAQGNAGLKFTPAANLFSPGSSFGFTVAAATSAAGAGLSSSTAVTVTVNPVADPPVVTQVVTTMNTQTTSGPVISRNAADSTEVTHFKITAITNGTLFQNDGTTQINNGDFITFAQGNAGLKFTPALGFTGTATFAVAGALDNSGTGLGLATTASIVVASAISPGDLVIREFRIRGTAGATDEYVVLQNKTSNTLTIGALDGSAGYSVASSTNSLVFTIPNGTTIKPLGFFLAANTAFSIPVTADATWSADVADGLGLALFNTATPANYSPVVPPTAVIDAVGFAGGSSPYIEGTGLSSLAAVGGEYAWVRLAPSGTLQDTGNNVGDFMLVATNGAIYNGVQSVLGAPAPTKSNLRDVLNGLNIQMVEPLVGPNLNPNRIRTGVGNSGTLEFRRRLINNTGAAITAIRLRVNDLSTLNSPGYTNPAQADLRPGTGPNVVITATSIGVTSLTGLTLMTPPAQGIGGGVNSVLLLPVAPLANGASIDINVRLNISRVGSYRYFITIEAQ